MPLAKLSELSVERFARIGRIVVLGVEEEKRDDGSTRGVEETGAELRRTVPAVALAAEKTMAARNVGSRSVMSTLNEPPNEWPNRHAACVNIRKTPHEREGREGVGHLPPFEQVHLHAFLALCPCAATRGPPVDDVFPLVGRWAHAAPE